MAITIRQMKVFEQVVKSGHVTRASEQLLLSQSAVSMAIAELEKNAGAPLFERRGKRLLLNDRGRQVMPEVREVLRRVDLIEQLLSESLGEPAGVLNVGASTTIGNYLLPLMVAEFSRQYPRAGAMLHMGNTRQIGMAVENGECDLGIVEGPYHGSMLSSMPWREDELVVIAGKGHPLAQAGKAGRHVLANASWVVREKGSGTREIFENAMAAKKIGYSVTMELGHTEAIKKAVEAGLGIGCLSRMAVKRELENGWLVEVESPLNLRRTLTILTREGGYQTALLNAFLSLLQDG